MLIDEIRAEQLAEVFHHYHQTLTSSPQAISASPAESWDELPQRDREHLIAAARLTLLELESDTNSRKYFARPGEAEWGC
jgi:hypothetical protein